VVFLLFGFLGFKMWQHVEKIDAKEKLHHTIYQRPPGYKNSIINQGGTDVLLEKTQGFK
jgi:hypothetical protein